MSKQSATEFTTPPSYNGKSFLSANPGNIFSIDPTAKWVSTVSEGFSGSYATTGNIYTVPEGRNAFMYFINRHNYGASSRTSGIYLQLDRTTNVANGAYATIVAGAAQTAGVISISTAQNTPTPLRSGDRLVLSGDTGVTDVFTRALFLEWSATSDYKLAFVNTVNGTNAIYTCPAGKNAVLVPPLSDANQGSPYQYVVAYSTNLLGSASVTVQVVPNGQSAATKYRVKAPASVSSGARSWINSYVPAVLTPGDALMADSTLAGVYMYALIYEYSV